MLTEKREENNQPVSPRIILGLDVSTVCIGISIIVDLGEGIPEIVKITHVSPKISSKKKGIEALLLRKNIFENEFLKNLVGTGITDVVIEEPLLSSNNKYTVGTLLKYNGMICDSVYNVLGIVPSFISSYDARMYSFPDLISLRKYNKKGEEVDIRHIKKQLKDNHLVLFGAYPFDIDKKVVMMNKVNEIYPNIEWILNKNGEIKKENYDACDSLVCALAYVNINRYGIEVPTILQSIISEENDNISVEYTMGLWENKYERKLIFSKK